MLNSNILDKYDCIWTPILTIKSEYSRFSLLTFHKVSLRYVISVFLDSPQKGIIIRVYDSLWDKKNQSMVIWLAIGPLMCCLIASFYAKRDRYCRHYDFCR